MQILHTAAVLGLADVLGKEGPQTAEQLAEKLGEHLWLLPCFLSMHVTASMVQGTEQGMLYASM